MSADGGADFFGFHVALDSFFRLRPGDPSFARASRVGRYGALLRQSEREECAALAPALARILFRCHTVHHLYMVIIRMNCGNRGVRMARARFRVVREGGYYTWCFAVGRTHRELAALDVCYVTHYGAK